MKRITIITLSILLMLSCRPMRSTDMFRTEKEYSFTTFDKTEKTAVIHPNDRISVIMATNEGHNLLDQNFTQQNIQVKQTEGTDYLIESDSLVKIPTLGRIKLGGMTIREAEDYLEGLFSENYQNPYVKIKITNRKVTIFFEEGKSGKIIPLPEEEMSLIEAIATAGGLSKNSKSYEIKLLRGNLNTGAQIYRYNIHTAKELNKYNFILEANDIIYVESRPRYLTKFLEEIQPYMILISTSLMLYVTIIRTNNL